MRKFFSALALITTITFCGYSQTESSQTTEETHLEVHKNLLAKSSSRMDKVITNAMQQEVLDNEAKAQGMSQETATLIDDLLQEASTHIGKRYVLGSKGPATFDCSGFSGYVYKQFGYTIGACSRDQYKYGKSIDIKDLRKGDLVFFTSRSSGSNVGHVGIVWEVDSETGDFKFIHASVRGVKISDFEGYYVSRYVGARRVIE